MIPTIGKVFLGTKVSGAFLATAQFTTDPKIQRNWPQRQSVHRGVQGTVTVQDFGKFAKDMVLMLESETNWINTSFKNYVDGLMAVRGAVYDYKDYMGTEAVVKIISFEAKPTFIRDGVLVLYEYSMELQVLALIKLDGVAYGGS